MGSSPVELDPVFAGRTVNDRAGRTANGLRPFDFAKDKLPWDQSRSVELDERRTVELIVKMFVGSTNGAM